LTLAIVAPLASIGLEFLPLCLMQKKGAQMSNDIFENDFAPGEHPSPHFLKDRKPSTAINRRRETNPPNDDENNQQRLPTHFEAKREQESTANPYRRGQEPSQT